MTTPGALRPATMNDDVKILVVDDSRLMRRMISDAVAGHEGFSVVGHGGNGREAIEELEAGPVDVLLLDLEMPVMDGLAVLPIVKQRWPRTEVIVFSSITQEGSSASVKALTGGAADCVLKPTCPSAEETKAEIARQLLPVVEALVKSRRSAPSPIKPRATSIQGSVTRPELITVASSTGGPSALMDLFQKLGPIEVPIAVVQHILPEFSSKLAERLARKSGMEISEAQDGDVLEAGMVKLAPGGVHMEICRKGRGLGVQLRDGDPVSYAKPSADVMFRSAAQVVGGRSVLGVVMTGMGSDGTDGSRLIADGGGEILIQDEKSSVIWGMPGSVNRAGLASEVLDVGGLARSIRARSKA